MQVDAECGSSVTATTRKPTTCGLGVQASVSVALHPLVLLNIADHWTRAKVQCNAETAKRVCGAVTGKQRGRILEVTNSFELLHVIEDGHVKIDRNYLSIRELQYKEVFPEQDFLGWYAIGDEPTPEDIEIHKQFCEINESPIFLKLNPQMMKSTDRLPLGIYESVLDIVQGTACIQFIPVSYNLVTEEAERIGIDHVARFSISDAPNASVVTEHLAAQTGALRMLSSRLRLVQDYLKAVSDGRLPQNDEILRQCAVLKHCLPVISGPKFDQAFGMQCNDISLVTYLGVLTKACCVINKLVNKVNALNDHRSAGFRRGKGLFINITNMNSSKAVTRALMKPVMGHFKHFSQAHHISRGGLFGLNNVHAATDFRRLTENVYKNSQILLQESLSAQKRHRKLVAVLDELSDTICQAADMAECVRMVHPNSSYVTEADHCVGELSRLVESLNSNLELYTTLRRALESGDADSSCSEPWDELDRRVAGLLADDMESSGIHLPDAQRSQFVQLNTSIFRIGSEFAHTAHEFRTCGLSSNQGTSFFNVQENRLLKLLQLRRELALLIGYSSYAERALRGSFLESPSSADRFLITLLDRLKRTKPPGRIGDLSSDNDQDDDDLSITVERFVDEKVNRIAGPLAGVRFELAPTTNDELWHPWVTKLIARDIGDSDRILGVVYCDWFERERKCGDAHFTVRCGRQLNVDLYQSPIVVLSFRLPAPSNWRPDTELVLSGAQVETMLHEFGHALHSVIGRTRYQHVSGTRGSTDLAEIPSTFLEHYVQDVNAAYPLWNNAFDHHRRRSKLRETYDLVYQSHLGLIDLRLHSVDPKEFSLQDICRSVAEELNVSPIPTLNLMLFDHFVPYGAKYHSYLVAKSLSALLWRRGKFSKTKPSPNNIFRKLLSFGGEQSPRELMQLTLDYVPPMDALAQSLVEDLCEPTDQNGRAETIVKA